MKQIFTVLILALLFSCKSDDNSNNDNKDTNKIDTSQVKDNNEKIEFKENEYFHFTGLIGEHKIAADGFKRGDNFSLAYYYSSVGDPILMGGNIDNDFNIDIKQVVEKGNPYETISGKFTKKGKIEGEWIMSDGKKKLKIELNIDETDAVQFEILNFYKKTDFNPDLYFEDKMTIYVPENKPNLKKIILNIFFEKESGDPFSLFEEAHKSIAKDFKEVEIEYASSWYQYVFPDIIYNNGKVLCYGIHSETFTGGAHGNYYDGFFVLNVETEKQINLNEVFNSGYESDIQNKIYENIKKQREFTDEEMAASYELPIKPSDNFYVNKYGIGFYYNPYDIAPYVEGPMDVFIPFKEIDKHVKKEFRKLLD